MEMVNMFPWILCVYVHIMLESLSIRDFFDIIVERKKTKHVYFTLVIVIMFAWLCFAKEVTTTDFAEYIMAIFFVIVEVLILYEGELWIKLLSAVGISAVCIGIDFIPNIVMEYLVNNDFASQNNEIIYLCYLGLAFKLAQMLIIKMLKCVVGKNRIKSLYKMDRFLIFFVPIAIMLNLHTNFMSNLYSKEITNWDIFGLFFLVMIGTLNYYVMYRMGDYYEEKSQFQMLENQLKTEKEYLNSLQQTHTRIRQLAHGLENQMAVVGSLLNMGEYDKAKAYLKELSNTVEQNTLPVHTNNIVIDAVLNQMFIIASSKKITINFNIQDLGNLSINDSDLAAILNNGITNAIEACDKILDGEKRLIEIQISNGAELMVSIQNTTAVETIEIVNNRVNSTKENVAAHGLGTESINMIAKKYHGKCFMECSNYNFHLLVVI